MIPMTHEEALAKHSATLSFLWSVVHYAKPGSALVEAFAQQGVHPARECADKVLLHLETSKVLKREKLAMNASQHFFDTQGVGRRKHAEHTAPASFFAWVAA